MEIENKPFAVITGASTGFGKCLALELAKRKHNTILVALPGEGIDSVAQQSRRLGVDSRSYETDLSVKKNILELTSWINAHFDVNILINNAGRGGSRSFGNCEESYIDSIIQLNITAISIITHQLLPNLQKQEQAYVLNVASMASFTPIGYKTVYPASKAFVLNFSRSLNQELKGCGVSISVVNPGPMMTNQTITERIEKQGILAKMGIVSPEKMAVKSLDKLFRKETVIVIGWMNKLNWLLIKLVPTWLRLPIVTNIVKKEIQTDDSSGDIADKENNELHTEEVPMNAA